MKVTKYTPLNQNNFDDCISNYTTNVCYNRSDFQELNIAEQVVVKGNCEVSLNLVEGGAK